MRMWVRGLVAALLLVPFAAGSLAAQNYRWDLGVNGGYSWYSDMLDDEEAGVPDDADVDVKFEPGFLLGAQLGYWFRPNIGLRANMTYADCFVEADVEGTNPELLDNVNLWSGSGDLLFRFRRPNTSWLGTEVLPYVALGLGAKWINPAGEGVDCDGDECHPIAPTLALAKSTSLMGLVGLGTDVRFAPNFALRLELNDRIYKPKIFQDLTGDNVAKVVHEIGAQVGLHMLFGLQREEVVSVIPAPAPPPAPLPPAAPAEEAVTVCVVDPTAPTGLRMQPAFYRPATRDTVVMVYGERVPLRQSVGTVMVARDADWFIRGQPLTLRIRNENREYVTYQGARYIEAHQLTYLGRINGYPVYADRDEVADVADAIASLREAERDRDLGEILAERRDLRDALNDVEFLYVPLEPTGCVFQPVQRLQQMRKEK